MSIPSESSQIREFDEIGNDFLSWEDTASELLHSASVLKEKRIQTRYPDGIEPKEPHHVPRYIGSWPELMLYAFAIECLLKGTWVKNGNKLAENGRYLRLITPENHNLVEMTKKVGIPMQEHQEEMLHRLSVLTIAVARYPIAKDWTVTRFRQWSNGGYSPLSWSNGDQAMVESLIEWLTEQIEK